MWILEWSLSRIRRKFVCVGNPTPRAGQLGFGCKPVLKICILFCKKTIPLFQILENSRELWIITKACVVKFTWVNHVDEISVDLSENKVSFTGIGIELNCIESSFISNADNVFSMPCHVVLVFYIGTVFAEVKVLFNHCWVFANKRQKDFVIHWKHSFRTKIGSS